MTGQQETLLAIWLREQMERRRMGRNQLAEYSGIGAGTISAILAGHIPKNPILRKLADYFKVSHKTVLDLAGVLPGPVEDAPLPDDLRALLSEFRDLDASVQVLVLRAWRSNLAAISEAAGERKAGGEPHE